MNHPRREDEFDARLARALAAAPRVPVPTDFAQRVLARVPARPRVAKVPVASTCFGRRTAFVSLGILLVAMVLVGLRAQVPGHTGDTNVEYSLAAEFIVVAVCLGLRPRMLG